MRRRKVVAMCGEETSRGFDMRFALDLHARLHVVRIRSAADLAGIVSVDLLLCETPTEAMLLRLRREYPWVPVVAFGAMSESARSLVDVQVAEGDDFLPRLRAAVFVALARKRGPRPVQATVAARREAVPA